MLAFLWKILRWLLLFSLLFVGALVATMPANTMLRLLQQYTNQVLPLQQVSGYLWRGAAELPYSGLSLALDWRACFVSQAPYLGLCLRVRNGEDEFNGKLTTLNGSNFSVRDLAGSASLLRLINSVPELEMLSMFGVDGTILVDLERVDFGAASQQLDYWEGVVSLIEAKLPGVQEVPRIDVELLTAKPDTNRREFASLEQVPQFRFNGGNDSLRVEGGGFINAERFIQFELILQSNDQQLQNTLRLVARPIGNNRFRVAWEGSY